MGSFIVFLFGLPSHSESVTGQARHLIQQTVQVMLVFFGLSTPVHQTPVPIRVARVVPFVQKEIPVRVVPVAQDPIPVRVDPAVLAPQPTVPVGAKRGSVSANADSLVLHSLKVHRSVAYVFEGLATYKNKPCPNARVLIRLDAGERSVTRDAVTGADGSYSIPLAVEAEENDLIAWTIEAVTRDFETVKIAGRRIVERQDEPDTTPVVVPNPVEFAVALSK